MNKTIHRDLILLLLGFLLGALLSLLISHFFFAPIVMPIISPQNGEAIITAINNAEKTIDIEVYLLTSDEVINALKNAQDRGVKIRIILEKRVMGGNNEAAYDALKSYGIKVKWASKLFKLTHIKMLITDAKRVILGSHNLGDNALNSNREASLLIEKTDAVDEFKRMFESDWEIATE